MTNRVSDADPAGIFLPANGLSAGDPAGVMYLRLTRSPLAIGGANTMIWESLRLLDKDRFHPVPCFIINAQPGRPSPNDGEQFSISYHCLVGRRFFDWTQFRQLSTLIQDHHIRIIHCHDYKSNLFAWLLKRRFPSLKLVTTIHGYINNTWRGRFYVNLDRMVARRFDRIILVSSSQQTFFPANCQAKLQVINNGLDLAKWAPPPERSIPTDRPPIVGYAGRISPEKGWREFVEIARLVIAQQPDCLFRVAGHGPHRAAMEQLVQQYRLASKFEFLGPVKDMQEFYLGLDMLLAPSHTEGLPMAQLEACALGIPVVATDVGGVVDLIRPGENGLLRPDGDIHGLADHVLALIGDHSRRRAMGQNGISIVRKHFSLANKVHILEQLYANVLEKADIHAS